MLWGILGRKSVHDFYCIYAIHVYFYLIGHPENGASVLVKTVIANKLSK